jgi:hypothetical protein
MIQIALKIPLTLFGFVGLLKGHNPSTPRVQVLGEPLDGASLSGCVPALEEDHDSLAVLLGPSFQLMQFDLKSYQSLLIFPGLQLLVVGVGFVLKVLTPYRFAFRGTLRRLLLSVFSQFGPPRVYVCGLSPLASAEGIIGKKYRKAARTRKPLFPS